MKDNVKIYKNEIEELKKYINDMPSSLLVENIVTETQSAYRSGIYKHMALFVVNMDTLTEKVGFYDEYKLLRSFEFPFLTTFNVIMSGLPLNAEVKGKKTLVYPQPLKNEFIEALRIAHPNEKICDNDKATLDRISPKLMEYGYVKKAIDDICALPNGLTIPQYFRYLSTLNCEEFRMIPMLSNSKMQNAEYREQLLPLVHDEENLSLFFDDFRTRMGILHLSLMAIASTERSLRKCKLCKKYFVPENRSDELYCRFPNKSRDYKPCKDAYKRIAQDERERNNEPLQLNKRIYNRLRNVSETEKEKYIKRRKEAKLKYKDDEAAYLDWLRQYDIDTRKRKGGNNHGMDK